MTNNEVERKLAQLRKDWVKYPQKRDIIELQAKILNWSVSDSAISEKAEDEKLYQDLLASLLK